MTRVLVLLALLVAGTLLVRSALGARERESAVDLERLASGVETKDAPLAALSVEVQGRGVRWLFARSNGRWRAREAYGAYLDERAFQAWLADVLDARGIVLADGKERATAYGFVDGALVTIGLHGPKVLDAVDRDRVAGFELARALDGRTFARRAGTSAILELDRDLLLPLGSLEPGALPPIVDRHLLAASIEAESLGFRRITLAERGRVPLVLRHEAKSEGKDARWMLAHDGRESEALPWRAGGFTSFLLRAEVLGFASRADAAPLGLDAPSFALVLEPDRGEPIELALGESTATNESWVWNRKTNLVMRIDARVRAELAPDVSAFLDPDIANPWERWLQNLGPTVRR